MIKPCTSWSMRPPTHNTYRKIHWTQKMTETWWQVRTARILFCQLLPFLIVLVELKLSMKSYSPLIIKFATYPIASSVPAGRPDSLVFKPSGCVYRNPLFFNNVFCCFHGENSSGHSDNIRNWACDLSYRRCGSIAAE